MEPALRSMIGAHAGRMYYNLSSLHAVLGAVPHGSVWVRYFNQFVGAHGVGCVAKTHRFEHMTDVLELGSHGGARGRASWSKWPRRVRAFRAARIDLRASLRRGLQPTRRSGHPGGPVARLRDDSKPSLARRLARGCRSHAQLWRAQVMACGALPQRRRGPATIRSSKAAPTWSAASRRSHCGSWRKPSVPTPPCAPCSRVPMRP